MKLTEAQRNVLQFASTIDPSRLDGVHPRRGQHQMYANLCLLGLMADAGRGVDEHDHMVEVDLYVITDAGRAALLEVARG